MGSEMCIRDRVGGDKKGLQLALSAADVPHLCYYDQNLNQLGYATYSGSSWVKEINVLSDDLDIDTSQNRGRYCDIEVDQYGEPHITFEYNIQKEIGYLKKTVHHGTVGIYRLRMKIALLDIPN